MPAGAWPPVPVRASSRHIRSWGDSGPACDAVGMSARDPDLPLTVHRSIKDDVGNYRPSTTRDPVLHHVGGGG
jgi:hypothetical protein